jgi:hypothetical protein
MKQFTVELIGQVAAYREAVRVEAAYIGCYLADVTNRKPFELSVMAVSLKIAGRVFKNRRRAAA